MQSHSPIIVYLLLACYWLFAAAGCGRNPDEVWSDLPGEERARRLADNLVHGEVYVAPAQREGDAAPEEILPIGKLYEVFGEIQFKDAKGIRLHNALVEVYHIHPDRKPKIVDQDIETYVEEIRPGVYEFAAFFDPINTPGRYLVKVGLLKVPFAQSEFVVK